MWVVISFHFISFALEQEQMSGVDSAYIQKFVKNQVVAQIVLANTGEFVIHFESQEKLVLTVSNFRISEIGHTATPYSANSCRKDPAAILSGPENPRPAFYIGAGADEPEPPEKPDKITQMEKMRKEAALASEETPARGIEAALQILCKLGKVPNGSTVTKRNGEKLYETREEIRIYRAGDLVDKITPLRNHTFLCADYGTLECMDNEKIVCWVVNRDELMKHLETHPLPY